MEYEVDVSRPRGLGEICAKRLPSNKACNLNRQDAMDNSRWKKLIKDG